MTSSDATDENSHFKTISALEFARRFKVAVVDRETRFTWFLGAGCSASSGVPTADEVARKWLDELFYLETGAREGVEEWAQGRFAGFDGTRPAAVYAKALKALFYTEQDLALEVERLVGEASPGFGYATLAQMMTDEQLDGRCNLTLTTNFDDLAADALYLYSRRRPNVLTHDSLSRRAPLTLHAPTVVKLHGDAHLGAHQRVGARAMFDGEVKERLRATLADSGLVLIGYGGREECVLDLLMGLPRGAPAGGVLWVHESPPAGALGEWMREKGGVWVQSADFDELMFLIRMEFGLGHPKIHRFESTLRDYEHQYQALVSRARLRAVAENSPERRESASAESAMIESQSRTIEASPRPTQSGARRRSGSLKRSLGAIARAVALPAAPSAASPGKDAPGPVLGQSLEESAAAADAAAPRPIIYDVQVPDFEDLTIPSVDNFEFNEFEAEGDPRAEAGEGAEDLAAEAVAAEAVAAEVVAAGDPAADDAQERMITAAVSSLALSRRAEAQKADLGDIDLEALPRPVGPLNPDAAHMVAQIYEAALAAAPDNGRVLARYAEAMWRGAQDYEGAEQLYLRAVGAAPIDAAILRDAAGFLAKVRGDSETAEALFRRALKIDLRDVDTLRAFAGFLLHDKGELDGAEDCFRLAIEIAPDRADALAEYADFLDQRRGQKQKAEAVYRRAVEAKLGEPRALSAAAEFMRTRVGDAETAEVAGARAHRLAPADAAVLRVQGRFAEQRGAFDEAGALYARAVAADPLYVHAHLDYAHFLRNRTGDLDAAEERHINAIEAAPYSAQALSAYAAFLAESRNDPAAAEEFHRRALDAEQNNPRSLAALAEFLSGRADMVEEAEALFQRALSVAPRYPRLLRAYGAFLSKVKGDVDAAEVYLRRAIEADPAYAEGLDELADFLHTVRQDADEAEGLFREALRIAPDRAGTLNRFAAFLRRSKRDLDAAETVYRRTVERNPRDAATLSRAAQFLLAEGRLIEGLPMLDDAFGAAFAMSPRERPRWLMLELWFARYAHDVERREEALSALLKLLDQGARTEGWNLEESVERAICEGHPAPDLLRDLARVASEGADPRVLRRHVA